MSTEPRKKRICIVGCGPAGMSTMYHFGKMSADKIPDIVCYEKQSTWGGMWNLTWRTGTDEYGEHVHACMYYDLWTNNPKELTEYPDYTFKTHFGKAVPSYVPGPVLRKYFEGRIIKGSQFDLRKYIRFNTVVRWIYFNKDTDDFTVKVKNLGKDKDEEEIFTHVIVATGLFGTPNIPTFPGLDQFQGDIIHAKDVRRAKRFVGKRILLIGSSLSAWDLALQFLKFGSKKIIMSYQTKPTGINWPEGIEERPLVEIFKETSVHFIDGTTAEIDDVVFCTGYKLHHPFLPEDLRIKPDMSIYPDDLYKGIVWMKGGNMKLLYLGAMYSTYFLTFLDVQALWACLYINGDIKNSTRQEMLEDMHRCMKERERLTSAGRNMEQLDFITDYLASMCKATEYQVDMAKTKDILLQRLEYLFEDATAYRDKQYRSLCTEQLSAIPSKPWMNDFDYPLEKF